MEKFNQESYEKKDFYNHKTFYHIFKVTHKWGH